MLMSEKGEAMDNIIIKVEHTPYETPNAASNCSGGGGCSGCSGSCSCGTQCANPGSCGK